MGRMGRAILAVLVERPYGLVLSGAVEAPLKVSALDRSR